MHLLRGVGGEYRSMAKNHFGVAGRQAFVLMESWAARIHFAALWH
jgi:hypothetical protein